MIVSRMEDLLDIQACLDNSLPQHICPKCKCTVGEKSFHWVLLRYLCGTVKICWQDFISMQTHYNSILSAWNSMAIHTCADSVYQGLFGPGYEAIVLVHYWDPPLKNYCKYAEVDCHEVVVKATLHFINYALDQEHIIEKGKSHKPSQKPQYRIVTSADILILHYLAADWGLPCCWLRLTLLLAEAYVIIVSQVHQTMGFVLSVIIWIPECVAPGNPYNYTRDKSHGLMYLCCNWLLSCCTTSKALLIFILCTHCQ